MPQKPGTGLAAQKVPPLDASKAPQWRALCVDCSQYLLGGFKPAPLRSICDIPVIKIGRRLRVPVRALERMLDGAGAKPKNEAK